MADPVLHIKDSYYFEVPKVLYPYEYRSRRQFPEVWVSLDPEYQAWEADRLLEAQALHDAGLPAKETVLHDWRHWVHADHKNFAKPLKVFLEEKHEGHVKKFADWKAVELAAARAKQDGSDVHAKRLDFGDYVGHLEAAGSDDQAYLPFLRWRHTHAAAFDRAKDEARNIDAWKNDQNIAEWSKAKIDGYNANLSGKILIPQPFATLRNFYEKESGFAISKYLVLEIVVGLIIVLVFSQLARKMEAGGPPRGKLWNLLETFLLFIRDQIVRPSLGSHHHEEDTHAEHGHDHPPATAHAAVGHGDHGEVLSHPPSHHSEATDPATKFLPLFWTIFFFVLGCNLMGMVPWAGAPTSAFAVTFAMACVTLVTVIVAGMAQFGFFGFFMNQIPGMDLPWYMAIIIKPMVFAIEMLGLLIKHGVLAVRLLANMVAGHLVILGIMGLAFGAEAALRFSDSPGWMWGLTATIAVISSAAFSVLELFVAFLQAYIITFLSALFVGAAIHKH